MTRPSTILLRPTFNLDTLPEPELNVLRKFFGEWVVGINPTHQKRWKRLGRQIVKSSPDEITTLLNARERSRPFHARWMAIETRIFENQDAYVNLEMFRNRIKTGAGFGTYHLVNGRMKFVPSSVAFEKCSDDEMREFVENATAWLRTPAATRKFWPHLSADDRLEMVETLLEQQRDGARATAPTTGD